MSIAGFRRLYQGGSVLHSQYTRRSIGMHQQNISTVQVIRRLDRNRKEDCHPLDSATIGQNTEIAPYFPLLALAGLCSEDEMQEQKSDKTRRASSAFRLRHNLRLNNKV